MNLLKIEIKNSDIILFIIVTIIIISYILIKIFTYKSEPILLEYAKKKSTNIVSALINESINNILYKNDYENIIYLEKDEIGNIISLNFNNKKINEILYLTTENILNNISLLEKGKYGNLDIKYIKDNNWIYYIPLGVIHDQPILNNLGPKIPFKIVFLGSIDNESDFDIKEYGINSFIVEIYINIYLQMQIILPFRSETIDINKKIVLDSKVIQGKVPEYYGGIITRKE